MEWLVIIISATLGVFLVLSIILIIKLIPVINNLRRITDRANNIAESVEATAENVKNLAPLAALVKILSQFKNPKKG